MDSTYAVYLQAYVGGLAGYQFFMRYYLFSQKLQCNLLQGALYSFGAISCGTRTRGWYANDHANCCLQIPLHACKGVASFISRLYRPRRAFSRVNLCTICWPCYLTLAIGCYCCILWINISKCPSRRLCRSSCISGFVPFLPTPYFNDLKIASCVLYISGTAKVLPMPSTSGVFSLGRALLYRCFLVHIWWI